MMVLLAADYGPIWLRTVLCRSSFVLTNVNQAIHQDIRDRIMGFSSELVWFTIIFMTGDWSRGVN